MESGVWIRFIINYSDFARFNMSFTLILKGDINKRVLVEQPGFFVKMYVILLV